MATNPMSVVSAGSILLDSTFKFGSFSVPVPVQKIEFQILRKLWLKERLDNCFLFSLFFLVVVGSGIQDPDRKKSGFVIRDKHP
jgi:hypothetical protein